eukprot:1943566-Amphidinium_carterae.1
MWAQFLKEPEIASGPENTRLLQLTQKTAQTHADTRTACDAWPSPSNKMLVLSLTLTTVLPQFREIWFGRLLLDRARLVA